MWWAQMRRFQYLNDYFARGSVILQYDLVMIYNTTASRWEGFQIDFTVEASVDTYVGGESVASSVDLTIATSETKNGALSPDSADDNITYAAGGAQSYLEFSNGKVKVRVLDEEGRHTRAGAEVRIYAAGGSNLLGTRRVDSGSGYNAQSDLPVHFGVPGGQQVDVEVIVTGGGRRTVTRVDGVDPRMYQGRAIEVRVALH